MKREWGKKVCLGNEDATLKKGNTKAAQRKNEQQQDNEGMVTEREKEMKKITKRERNV